MNDNESARLAARFYLEGNAIMLAGWPVGVLFDQTTQPLRDKLAKVLS